MNTVASVPLDYPESHTGDMDSYLTNIDNVYGINEPLDYTTFSSANTSCEPVFLENGIQLSFDGSNFNDYSGSFYPGPCYGTNDTSLYPDMSSSIFANTFAKSEQDLGKYTMDQKYAFDTKYRLESKYSIDSLYSIDPKYPMDAKFSMENGDLMQHTSTPNLPYLTPKVKPNFEYMNPITNSTSSTSSTMSSAMPAVGTTAMGPMTASMPPAMPDMLSPGRAQHPIKVTTHDLAMFNSLMDGSVLTPIRASSTMLAPNQLRKTKSLPTGIPATTAPGLKEYQGLYHFEEEQTGPQYIRQPPTTQKTFNYETEFSKSVDSLMLFPSERNVPTTTSQGQDTYQSAERPPNNYQYQNSAVQEGEADETGENYYAPTSVTTNVTRYSVPTFDPNMPPEERYREVLKAILKSPPTPESFMSPINSNVLNSFTIKELGERYDEAQRAANQPETHVMYVRHSSDMNLVLRNDNLLIQHSNRERNERLKMSKQVLSSKDVASSSDLNECMARSRNDEQGMSYLPYVSCNWKGVHETSWWMSDAKGVVRNFKVRFDPAVFGSKNTAYEEATKFGKFVEGLIRPGTLISWYPGFNIPIGTSGRANLRKVLHMDRMKNADLCDPVLEANGLKVAAKSTFGDMIIVELYKAAYLLGLWDVAAYNCLKTCKRRGYSFEWIHNIQASGKRITLDALKYMRNVKEVVEQDKISRVNSEKKRRRRKASEKRRKTSLSRAENEKQYIEVTGESMRWRFDSRPHRENHATWSTSIATEVLESQWHQGVYESMTPGYAGAYESRAPEADVEGSQEPEQFADARTHHSHWHQARSTADWAGTRKDL
ncbi:conserved hypothetical protein [Theileria orientalis strain Shintoku]|uniref:Uncharacterized protein n=1 Tax=Theileria orientalis strain Shintoku TaxID=869250 RepID=J4C8P6_THEOR|nr:conserved hypothetical protein [Theileria orientalis strain Shintoku]PVC54375.1 hypothetical protein MACL_00003158 [Theileria orientalis]BAM41153.1 conserved hypothetical protein [Theileria orientalis strain Shintoku]|eukprot:XP_009691454.1 conserved hypothetical protein [Theileria orientalis strain Shintoku]